MTKHLRKKLVLSSFFPVAKKAAVLSFFALLLCPKLYSQNYKWGSLRMGGAGFVSGIITSKGEQNLMYCRTDVGGAYKWNAATSTWAPLLDWVNDKQSGFYGVESMAIDPQATAKLYLYVGINYFDGGKTAILRSNDYGQTFTTIDVTNQFKAHGNGAGRSNGERLQVDPNLGSVLYVGTRANGLWKSVDYGSTWTQLTGLNVTTTPNGNGVCFVLIDPSSGTPGNPSQTLYAGVSRYGSVGDNFYKSTDGGLTFTPITGGPSAYMPQRAVLTGEGNLIMNYADGAGPSGNTSITPTEPMGNGGIYKYNIAGNTWTNITPPGIAHAWGGLTVDPNNPQRMMASTINNYQLQYGPATGGAYGDRIYLTTNGGASWRDVVNPGFALNTNGAPWIYGQAIHWAGSLEFDPFNTSKVYVTSGNGVFSNDNIDEQGNPWKFDVKGLEETVPTAVVSLPGGPLYTTIGDYDGFRYTSLTQYGERLSPTMGTTTGLAYAGSNTNYLARVGSKIYYSTDGGASWTATAVINGSQGKIALTANGSAMVHCPNGSSNIYYSNNNGASWTVATNTAGGAAFGLSNAIPVADMVNPNKVYLYNNGSGNFSVSATGGSTFGVIVNIGANGSKLMRAIPGIEGDIWVPMYTGGLKHITNAGITGTVVTTVAGVAACSAVGYGKAAPGASYLTLYIWGTVGGVTGIFKSIDAGTTWTRLNDDAHQFGGPGNAQAITGDMNNYGVVYMTTVGRGVVMGYDPALTPLPISLTALDASLKAPGQTQLAWTTANENNNAYFEVERSSDGRSFGRVGSVPTAAPGGNSSQALHYGFTDNAAGLSGLVYYRLKQVDGDGRAVYSKTVQVRVPSTGSNQTVAVYPNPSSSANITLTVFAAASPAASIKITDLNGHTVYVRSAVKLITGANTVSLAGADRFSAGIYWVEVRNNDGTIVGRTKFAVQ